MIVRIERQNVDVVDKNCKTRECLQIGMDHGPYVQGRGYTMGSKYKSKPVCLRRHLHGCPVNSVCPLCRSASIEAPGAKCKWGTCDGVTVACAP